ncbi:hypothetical protein SSAG_05150 [Streptomyces sp. Mg1]|nr:hypothetical protein SSAG_05150 [Streptomyces sp. Mg1]
MHGGRVARPSECPVNGVWLPGSGWRTKCAVRAARVPPMPPNGSPRARPAPAGARSGLDPVRFRTESSAEVPERVSFRCGT